MKKILKIRLFFFITGALLFGLIGVGAASLIYSVNVTYDNTLSGLKSTTVQGALDELYESAKKGGTNVSCDSDGNCTVMCGNEKATINNGRYGCPLTCENNLSVFENSNGESYKCLNLTDGLELGTYISMTPTNSTFSDANLWRVIHKNEDGTVDMILNYMVETMSFGKNSYNSYILTLNSLLKKYTNDLYISSYRYPNNEDVGYIKEANSIIGYSASDKTPQFYCIAETSIGTSNYYNTYNLVYIDSEGKTAYHISRGECQYSITSPWYESFCSRGVSYDGSILYAYYRPIVTLKSTIKISGGKGTETNPSRV